MSKKLDLEKLLNESGARMTVQFCRDNEDRLVSLWNLAESVKNRVKDKLMELKNDSNEKWESKDYEAHSAISEQVQLYNDLLKDLQSFQFTKAMIGTGQLDYLHNCQKLVAWLMALMDARCKNYRTLELKNIAGFVGEIQNMMHMDHIDDRM